MGVQPELIGQEDATCNQSGLAMIFEECHFHIVDRLVTGRPLAMSPCGSFLGRLMKSAECPGDRGTAENDAYQVNHGPELVVGKLVVQLALHSPSHGVGLSQKGGGGLPVC